jgi:hypothetical protein
MEGNTKRVPATTPYSLAVQLPPDIDGELLCLWPGQDYAMAQRMEEHGIADPALLYHQVVMHDGNVGRCPAKADPSQLEPKPLCLLEGRSLHCSDTFSPQHSRSREQEVHKRICEIL